MFSNKTDTWSLSTVLHLKPNNTIQILVQTAKLRTNIGKQHSMHLTTSSCCLLFFERLLLQLFQTCCEPAKRVEKDCLSECNGMPSQTLKKNQRKNKLKAIGLPALMKGLSSQGQLATTTKQKSLSQVSYQYQTWFLV